MAFFGDIWRSLQDTTVNGPSCGRLQTQQRGPKRIAERSRLFAPSLATAQHLMDRYGHHGEMRLHLRQRLPLQHGRSLSIPCLNASHDIIIEHTERANIRAAQQRSPPQRKR